MRNVDLFHCPPCLDPIIAGVSDGFAIGIIIISIVVISLISVLVVFMVRHYRAQQVMVVGKNNGDADQKMPTTTARCVQYDAVLFYDFITLLYFKVQSTVRC